MKREGVVNGPVVLRGCVRYEWGIICWIWAMKDTGDLDMSNFYGMLSMHILWSR